MDIKRFTLSNTKGASLDVINFGAAITALRLPDRSGEVQDIVLGFDDPKSYRTNSNYFGVVVGRFANRIAHGRFRLNEVDYQLACNNGAHHLHGGATGFHQKLWGVEHTGRCPDGEILSLNCLSKDGEEEYPGNLSVTVKYRLTDANELIIDYSAITDMPTIINLTQHSYFNLAGHDSGDILDHKIRINASHYTPVGEGLVPTGEIAGVAKTPLDLQAIRRIGDIIGLSHPQLQYGEGFDHNYVLKPQFDAEMRLAAEVREPRSGRVMRVMTDQPGLQFYSGNVIAEGTLGKSGAVYNRHQGLCLETKHFPDSPNHGNFPSVELLPGQTFKSRTKYHFGIDCQKGC